jgi:hypothetical protein
MACGTRRVTPTGGIVNKIHVVIFVVLIPFSAMRGTPQKAI